MNVNLVEIQSKSRLTLENLFPYYIYDMSEFTGWGPTKDGHYDTYNPANLDIYWSSEEHVPYFILADNELAGFVLIRKYPVDRTVYDIDQYFILRKFKKQGIGKEALKQVLHLYPGKWQIRVLKENTGAFKFWLSAVSEIVGQKYVSEEDIDVDLLMNFIRFEVAPQTA
ncbi:hypothetical protein VA7868_01245 [Vibrio aerogenes CECT 7868]|uniref:N-acetyltransferase domain-containing protein n=1 Tax=Vibrio aerogenes CECT 7868 TaxID=1216006 RepID=A0A1M5XQY1_9VIBR|nr:GNAT family N-acetyltransferase [Vibrio aerogenes]SHI01663.1 hypothetical protein VA7868_01245 [Vibrio aerogenes CECT 7868]